MKKLISLLLSVLMILSIVPIGAVAATNAIITVQSTYAKSGATVDVAVSITNNPGILGMTLEVEYDESAATLVGVRKGEALGYMTFTVPKNLKSGCNLPWDAEDVATEDIKDGTIAVLTFELSETAEVDDFVNVSVSYDSGAIIDKNMAALTPETVDGGIQVLDYTPGDLNDNGIIDTTDVVLLRRHIAGGYNVTIVENAGDVNADGKLNTTDVVIIRRYIAGGYNVEPKPAPTECKHRAVLIVAKESTCVINGNIAHYQCSLCGELFSDAQAENALTEEDVLLALKEHTVVIDEAVPATTTTTGLTEGSHCGACNVILVKQEIIPVIVGYGISYHLSVGNSYIAQQTIDISDLVPHSYEAGKVTEIPDLPANTVPGFEFNGWYDAIEGGNRIDHISSDKTGDVRLYARWTAIPYEINYVIDAEAPYELKDSDGQKIPAEAKTYTVDVGKRELPVLRMDGYIFVGWSDEEGTICKAIPVGTTGNIKLYANWLSERNQAWAKKELGDPVILEQDNYILFAYEIGEVKNVPVYTMIDFGKINGNGVAYERTETYETKISESLMTSYTKSLTNATTNSLSWTLSDGWTDAVSVNEEWAQENNIDITEAETIGKSDSNNWYISSGQSGGSSETNTASTENYDLHTKTENSKEFNETGETDSVKSSIGAEVKVKTAVGVVGGVAKANYEAGISAKLDTELTVTSKTGSETDEGSSDQTGSISNAGYSGTSHSEWNTESGYGGSSTVSQESTISQTLSEKISKKTDYGKEYIQTGNQSETQDQTSTEESSEEYASAVTFEKTESHTLTETFSTANTVTGYHRIVMVTTAHVFGVVGYDIANDAYFVYTYSILDKDVRRFEDYSYKTGSYNDHENGLIPFNAPFDIAEYVAEKTAYTEGLVVNAAGAVTGYTGDQKTVMIPEYWVEHNELDGTSTAIKITGLGDSAFANKDIEVIKLSDFITEIPAKAFENCTSLICVEGRGLTSIKENAFAGCTSLKIFELGDNIEEIGANAFSSAESLTVVAASKDVALAALACGAEKIKIIVSDACNDLADVELAVPDNVTTFIFDGKGKTFDNVRITSSAAEVGIYNATFNSTGKIPLHFNSADVELMKTTVNAAGIAMVLEGEQTNLMLYGESYLNTTGENALLCKAVTLSKIAPASTHTELHIDGSILICDNINDIVSNNLYNLHRENASLTAISASEFEKQKKGIVSVALDACGGTTDPASLTCFYGTAIGTLPVPVKEYHTFLGWFTEETAGEQVTEEYILTGSNELTLFAHWEENQWSEWTTDTSLLDSDLYTVEQRTETRSRTKEFKDNSTATLEGWIANGSTTQYGDWVNVGWTKTQPTVSSTLQITNQKTVKDYTNYNLYYYRYWNSSQGKYLYTYSSSMGGTYYSKTVRADGVTYYTTSGGHDGYTLNNKSERLFSDELWFIGSTSDVTHTEWYYQTRTETITYHFYRWLAWTSWDVESVTPDENTEVETRTVYRYILK